MVRWSVVALLAGSLAGTALAQTPAQPAPSQQGDLHRGKELSYTCLGCHGIDGYRNAYPDYSVPKLEGQHPEYLVAALHGYRDGDRSHLTMHSQASELSDQDILDIAVFFAGKPLTSSGNSAASEPKAVTLCTACHGKDGVAIAAIYPSLAGQHQDYLVRALHEYQNGGRKNPVMKGFAAPGLKTEPRPYTRFTAQ